MQKKIETIILSKLISDEDYLRKVIPFIKDEYFSDNAERLIYRYINEFVTKYNSLPTIDAINIALQNDRKVNEKEYQHVTETLTALDDDVDANEKWLLDQTEKFCKDRAVYNAIMHSSRCIVGRVRQQRRP